MLTESLLIDSDQPYFFWKKNENTFNWRTGIRITGFVRDPVGYLDFPYVKEIQMVTDNQLRMLIKLVNQKKLLETAAAKPGMSEKSARKPLYFGLPSIYVVTSRLRYIICLHVTSWRNY